MHDSHGRREGGAEGAEASWPIMIPAMAAVAPMITPGNEAWSGLLKVKGCRERRGKGKESAIAVEVELFARICTSQSSRAKRGAIEGDEQRNDGEKERMRFTEMKKRNYDRR